MHGEDHRTQPLANSGSSTGAPPEPRPTPWWMVLLGARRAVLWGTEPADVRSWFTGCTGDCTTHPDHEHHHGDHHHGDHHHGGINHGGPTGAEQLWENATRDAGGGMGRDEFLALAKQIEAKAKEHEEEDHVDIENMRLYKLPFQRNVWGVRQIPLHPWLGDTIHDLIVVGICYCLGDVVKYSFYECAGEGSTSGSSDDDDALVAWTSAVASSSSSSSPSSSDGGGGDGEFCIGVASGVMHAAAFYYCTYRLWSIDVVYRARFCADGSAAHLVCQVVIALLVVFASHGVRPNKDLIAAGLHAASGMLQVAAFCLGALGLTMLRDLELMLLHPREASRRCGSLQLLNGLGTAAWWGAAIWSAVHATRLEGGSAEGRLYLTLSAALALLGGAWFDLRLLFIFFRERHQRRRGYVLGALDRRRKMVPIHVEFCIHRRQEFMYLMLGETVLQLVVSSSTHLQSGTLTLSTELRYHAVVLAGFVATLCMAHSYHLTEPASPDHHAMRRSAVSGLVYQFLFGVKGFAVLCVGIGYKIALYDPSGEHVGSCQPLAPQQQLAFSMAACFGLQPLMHPLHVGFKRYYSPRCLWRRPRRTATIALRLLVIAAMGLSVLVAPKMELWAFAVLQAGLAVVACVLLQVQLIWYGNKHERKCCGMKCAAAKEGTRASDDHDDQPINGTPVAAGNGRGGHRRGAAADDDDDDDDEDDTYRSEQTWIYGDSDAVFARGSLQAEVPRVRATMSGGALHTNDGDFQSLFSSRPNAFGTPSRGRPPLLTM